MLVLFTRALQKINYSSLFSPSPTHMVKSAIPRLFLHEYDEKMKDKGNPFVTSFILLFEKSNLKLSNSISKQKVK
jgi:hypothetical protein